MENNRTKYLILVLIAFFFASVNELDAKEAEQNFSAESHTFIATDNFSLEISSHQHQTDKIKVRTPNIFIKDLGYSNNFFCLFSAGRLKFIPPSFTNKIYLNISVIRI